MTGEQSYAVAADVIFDGVDCQIDSAVIIEGSTISAIVPRQELPPAIVVRELPQGAWLAPGFIDLQVNGGGDVLFNDCPTPASIATIARAHRRFGTTAILPTLMTSTPETMRFALQAASEAAANNPGILGIHLEGPFLSPEKPGVHDPALIRLPNEEDIALLTAPRPGVTLVTLAPECVPVGFIAQLARAGLRVSLGHSMASYAQTKAAFAEGLTGITHVFNAMRPLGSREPGPIAAALEMPNVWIGMIADGHHVHPAMIRLVLSSMAHSMLVTDAMPPVGGSQTEFNLHGETIKVENGRCARSDAVLAGSALDMATAIRNCVTLLDLPLTRALRLASTEPALFLGLGATLGCLAAGYRADMVSLDPHRLTIHETWVAGKPLTISHSL